MTAASHGNGRFWDGPPRVRVTGMDLAFCRAPHVVGDYRALPFTTGSFDVAIFDLPYHTDMGCGKASVMRSRFGTFGTSTSCGRQSRPAAASAGA